MLHLIILSISSILLVITINLALKIYQSRTCNLNKLPGPKPSSLIFGSALDLIHHSFTSLFLEWWKQAGYETTSMLYYTGAFGSKNLLILDADIVHEILTSPPAKKAGGGGGGGVKLSRAPSIIRKRHFMKLTLGDSLLSLDGADWIRHRKIIQPSFNLKSLKVSLSACVSDLVPVLIESWTACEGVEIDVTHHLSALTLDIIGIVGFSHNFNAMEEVKTWSLQHCRNDADGNKESDETTTTTTTTTPGLSNRFLNAFQTLMKPKVLRILAREVGLSSLYNLFDFSNRRVSKSVDDYADDIVKDAHYKMKQLENDDNDNDASTTTGKEKKTTTLPPRSILNLLMMAASHPNDDDDDTSSFKLPRESFSDRELRDEIKGFILAGHETTSTWMYWCFYALVTYPDVQKLVYEDIIKIAPPTTDDNDGKQQRHVISLEDIERMPYFNAFVMEVLRFYSPIVQNPLFVNNKNGITLGGSGTSDVIKVPNGTCLIIPPYLLHRHPSYWNNPNEFLPARWLNNNDGSNKPYKHPCAFIPFSAGHRTCIGSQFATIELKLVMAPLVRALGVTLAPSQRDVTFESRGVMFLKNDPSLKVCVRAR